MEALNGHLRSAGGAECQRTLEANGRMPNFASGVMPQPANDNNNSLGVGGSGQGKARPYSGGSHVEGAGMAKTEDAL